jgi:hypothetical protein
MAYQASKQRTIPTKKGPAPQCRPWFAPAVLSSGHLALLRGAPLGHQAVGARGLEVALLHVAVAPDVLGDARDLGRQASRSGVRPASSSSMQARYS